MSKAVRKKDFTQEEVEYLLSRPEKLSEAQLAYLTDLCRYYISSNCKYNTLFFIENFVHIEDRDAEELAQSFKLWDGQKKVLEEFTNNRLNIVLKARQLGLTWLALAYAVNLILFNPGVQVVGLSKTEDDAKELVRRIVFILQHIPGWMVLENTKKNEYETKIPKWTNTTMNITIKHKKGGSSVFNSMSASPNSGRSFTANLVIIDEWAFQQFAQEIWSAAYPTINRPAGGKVIGLSTAKRMTLFEDIWNDSRKGRNTFNSIFLPWNTDPRRTQEWYEQTKRDLPMSYKAEYPNTPEEAFYASEGVAFAEFSTDIHVCKPFEIPSYWRRWRSVDNGYTDPFAWYWYTVSDDGVVYVYKEYTRNPLLEGKVIYSDQAKKVVELTGNEKISYTVAGLDAWNVHHLSKNILSPQGKSIIDYYSDGGVKDCIRAITDRVLRKATIHEYLKPYYDGNIKKVTARVQIFDTCKVLIDVLPKLLNDEKDPEKVAECSIDHCLTGDTIINTVSGDFRIDELVGLEGMVNCFDEINNVVTISNFNNVRMTSKSQRVYKITTEDGRVIKCTDYHPILTSNGWKTLKELKVSDEIIDISKCL